MPTNVTLQQMLRHSFVTGVVSQVKSAGMAFQQFYQSGIASIPSEPSNLNRHITHDIFNETRTMAAARAPDVGPASISPKPIGQSSATALRLYEQIPFPIHKIAGTRPLGSPIGTLDPTGRSWVVRQQGYLAKRFSNSIEFMVSRMFRGGFSILIQGDNYYLRELGAGTVDINYPIPAGNKAQIGGLIDATWANAGTKILDHMLELNKLSQIQTGYEIRHCWINSTTYKRMLANTQLQSVRGTASRVFEQFSPANVQTTEDNRNIGFTVIFPAMPNFVWHVYDASSVVATATDPASHTTGNNSLYVPDNIAIFTPEVEPGGWHGMYHAQEYIREKDNDEYTLKSGFATWTKPINDPPGEELRALHNLVPLMYVPASVFYATVIF